MAELLKYSFNSTDFYRDSNGVAKLTNLGTLGTSNDATLYTGQGLEFDGFDDYIPTDIVLDTSKPQSVIHAWSPVDPSKSYYFRVTTNDGTSDGVIVFIGQYASTVYMYANAYLEKNVTPVSAGNLYRGVISMGTSSVTGYINGASGSEGTVAWTPIANVRPYYLFSNRNSDAVPTEHLYGVGYFLAIIDAEMTADDALYDWQNPEAIIEMAATGIDNTNFSFAASAIKNCITLDEGTGDTVYDIITGKSYTMVNFPTDDTQWTNADQNEYSHQLVRFKKDANHNPSGPVDAHTIRYD